MKIKGSWQPRKGPAKKGLRWLVVRLPWLVLISVVGSALWQVFCLVEIPAWTCSHRGVSLMAPETPKHAQQSQAKLKAKEPRPITPAPPQKGMEESPGPILKEEGRDPGLQEQCRQVMHQLDAITTAPFLVRPPPSKQRQERGNWSLQQHWSLFPPCLWVPTTSSWQWIHGSWGSMSKGN